MTFDILITNGMVIDGSGRPAFRADVGVAAGRIAAIGLDLGDAKEVIDAAGCLVTPGFIDPHTHFDGQATWDQDLRPSSDHGVTTAVMGACGIGFAPVRKGDEAWLITLTEGVEDIPGTALSVGIPWGWETFPEYLDHLASRSFALDVATHVPHSALRAFVLGKRAENDEPATQADLKEMSQLVREAVSAGAVGFATSRVSMHRGSDGSMLPGTTATEEELRVLVDAMCEGGGGVLQVLPSGITGGVEGDESEQLMSGAGHLRDQYPITAEIQMLRRLSRRTGQPVTFSLSENAGLGDVEYEKARALVAEAASLNEPIYPQFSPRPVGGLLSLDSHHPFNARPTYQALRGLPKAERARKMAEPAVKAAILGEEDIDPGVSDPSQHIHKTLQRFLDAIYSLDGLDYEPDLSRSMAAIAAAEGREPMEVCYDALIADEGNGILIWWAGGYADGDLRRKEQCIADPQYLMGLGDAGAHVQFICDANFPTFLLTHWGRDRTRGRTFPVEQLVKKLTKDPADLYGLNDRGVIAVGKRADINVIDFERLELEPPRIVQDLPANAKRFLQSARGYAVTMVNGCITRRDGEATGAYPGRLVRGQNVRAPATKRAITSTQEA